MFCLALLQTNQLKDRDDRIAFILRKVYNILTLQALKCLTVLWIVENWRSLTKTAKNQRLSIFREN